MYVAAPFHSFRFFLPPSLVMCTSLRLNSELYDAATTTAHIWARYNFFFLNKFLYFHFSIPEPTPSTMTALHQFGAEMLKLSRGLESVSAVVTSSPPLKPNLNTVERRPATAVVLNR